MSRKPLIWFFKDAESAKPYGLAFNKEGFNVRFVQVLRFEFEEAWDPVPEVDAIIVTSRRAADSIISKAHPDALLPPSWREIPWYVMGPSTAERVQQLGISVAGSGARTSNDLAEKIIRMSHPRVAFMAGDPHRPELPQILVKAGAAVEVRIVYRAVPSLTEALNSYDAPDFAAFFSPRGVEIAAGVDGPDWRKIGITAIGPTTAAAVRNMGWNLIAVSDGADPQSLLQSLHHSVTSSEPESSST